MRHKSSVVLGIGATILFLFAAACGIIRAFTDLKGARMIAGERELPFKTDEFKNVTDKYASGAFAEDNRGIIELPPSLAGITTDGRVYVTKHDSWGTLLLFVTWQGKGSNMRGFLFRKDAAAAAQLRAKNGQTSLTILGPSEIGPKAAEVDVEKSDRPDWYQVKRDKD